MVNPGTAGTIGSVKEALQATDGAESIGAAGNTTAFTVVSWQAIFALVTFVAIPPQAAASLYLALMVQHPGVFVNNEFAVARSPKALNTPPGACTAYSAVKPGTSVTAAISLNLESQVFAIGVNKGAGGNTIALIVVSWQAVFELNSPPSVPPQSTVNLYLAFIVQHPGVFVNSAFAVAKSL
jgi:hypothetical protein